MSVDLLQAMRWNIFQLTLILQIFMIESARKGRFYIIETGTNETDFNKSIKETGTNQMDVNKTIKGNDYRGKACPSWIFQLMSSFVLFHFHFLGTAPPLLV